MVYPNTEQMYVYICGYMCVYMVCIYKLKLMYLKVLIISGHVVKKAVDFSLVRWVLDTVIPLFDHHFLVLGSTT